MVWVTRGYIDEGEGGDEYNQFLSSFDIPTTPLLDGIGVSTFLVQSYDLNCPRVLLKFRFSTVIDQPLGLYIFVRFPSRSRPWV